jgi:pimeloyl-ACP methyl ester carboxylesterase
MARLGYDRYGTQGGDVGAGVAGMLGMLHPDRVAAVHLNGPVPSFPLGPQTLAYALNDSPAAQLAWIVEKFKWTDPAAELPTDAVDRDRLLTNVSLYWFTGSGASAANFLYEGMQPFRGFVAQAGAGAAEGHAEPMPAGPPTGVAVFAADNTIRSLIEPTANLVHWSEFDRGGHFAAMEAPDLLVGDVRSLFRARR